MQTRRSNTLTKAAFAATLASVSNAHMTMKTPAPFGSISKVLTTSPLTSAQFPCQVGSDPATFYSTEGLNNTIAIGQSQTLSFSGSAVHGGGSCQLALTKDMQPDASTSWEVFLSIEGGCPSKDGNGPSTYDYTIPNDFAAGDYVMAWTWISKESGTQEYYMNCAPISLTGGTGGSKRAAASYPQLGVFNLAEINSCKSVLSSDPVYPDPGPNVQKPGTDNAFEDITGTNCVPKGQTTAGSLGSGSGSGSSPSGGDSSSTAAASSTAASSPASSPAASSTTASAPAATTSVTGFQTTTLSASSSPASTTTTPVAASSTPAAASSSAAAPSSSPSSSPGGSTTGGLSGACTNEGTFNCVGGTQYQQCASGSWSVLMAMPSGTKCQEGETTTLWARSNEHERNGAFMERRSRLY
ncbi:hypothetical protein F5Y16DRAFT_388152 [Xylariaceae sp. FL0255]|nr:hypothetical protein F5Y16DRAFT_388152 [Xylariaceae sp. FL0255]